MLPSTVDLFIWVCCEHKNIDEMMKWARNKISPAHPKSLNSRNKAFINLKRIARYLMICKIMNIITRSTQWIRDNMRRACSYRFAVVYEFFCWFCFEVTVPGFKLLGIWWSLASGFHFWLQVCDLSGHHRGIKHWWHQSPEEVTHADWYERWWCGSHPSS